MIPRQITSRWIPRLNKTISNDAMPQFSASNLRYSIAPWVLLLSESITYYTSSLVHLRLRQNYSYYSTASNAKHNVSFGRLRSKDPSAGLPFEWISVYVMVQLLLNFFQVFQPQQEHKQTPKAQTTFQAMTISLITKMIRWILQVCLWIVQTEFLVWWFSSHCAISKAEQSLMCLPSITCWHIFGLCVTCRRF